MQTHIEAKQKIYYVVLFLERGASPSWIPRQPLYRTQTGIWENKGNKKKRLNLSKQSKDIQGKKKNLEDGIFFFVERRNGVKIYKENWEGKKEKKEDDVIS